MLALKLDKIFFGNRKLMVNIPRFSRARWEKSKPVEKEVLGYGGCGHECKGENGRKGKKV